MRKFIYAATVGLTGAFAACADDGRAETTGALFTGLHADDDGCPGAWGCKVAADEAVGASGVGGTGSGPADIKCNPWGCEPWPARDGVPAGVIVGPTDYHDLACYPLAQRALANGLGRFAPAPPQGSDLASCSGVLLEGDHFLTSVACIDYLPSRGEPVGVVEFGAAATVCDGPTVAEPKRFRATMVRAHLGLGVALLYVGREVGGTAASPAAAGIASAEYAFDEPPNGSTVALASHQGDGLLAKLETGCVVDDWHVNGGSDFFFAEHGCDTIAGPVFWAEHAAGAPIVDLAKGRVIATHLGSYPGGFAANLGISFGQLKATGFFVGTAIGQ